MLPTLVLCGKSIGLIGLKISNMKILLVCTSRI
nr:MAG TPA: hypothetical protein [Caudoviricetes sp.]